MERFKEIEKKWQEKWYSKKIFEPSIEKKKKKFFFTVPYPYVSGALHVGHGRTYVNGDVIARFKRMQGYNALWPIAFHITGTPVLAVSRKIAANDKETIKLYEEYASIYEDDKSKVPKIVKSFKEPWNLVNYFSSKMIHDFKSIGFSLDLSRQFTTGDKEYNAFIRWQFHKYKEAGYLKQASYPILYCVEDRNAVGEDDIQEADTNPVDVQRFTAPKFKLGKSFLVTATLRQDTIYGVTNIFVKPSAIYVEAEVKYEGKKEVWIVAKQSVEKLELQGMGVKITREFKGEELVRKTVETPTKTTVPVLPAEFVDPEAGTGVVHSVPSDAPFDLVAIQELKKDEKTLAKYPGLKEQVNSIKPIPVISCPGYGEIPARDLVEKHGVKNTKQADLLEKITKQLYKNEFYSGKVINSGEFTGLSVEKAKEEIGQWLEKNGKAHSVYEPSRQAACRCGGKVVAAILPDQWFLDFNAEKWKEKANKCLEKTGVFPPNYRKQFVDIFAWLDKRPCARRRGLGTQLPFANEWIIESLSDSTIYPAFYTVIKEIRNRKLKHEQLTPEFFDYVFLGKGKAEDVAKKIKAKKEDVEAVKKEFEYWYPCDQRHTAIAHISNHLSFYIFAHAAIFSEKHWPKSITVNELLTSEGRKMSKSKGNVVTLDDVRRNYFADLYRLYSIYTADFSSVLDFRKSEIENSRKSFYRLYTGLENAVELSKEKGKQSRLTAWIMSRFENTLKKATQDLEGFRLRDYAQTAVYSMLNDWEYFCKRATEEEKAFAARRIVKKWILLLAPLIPHSCEELWEKINGVAPLEPSAPGEKGFASLATWPKTEEKLINLEAEEGENYLQSALEDARRIKQLLARKNKKPAKCTFIVASRKKWLQLAAALEKNSPDNVQADEALKAHLDKHFYALKENPPRQINEANVLTGAGKFLESELEAKIEIEPEEKSKSEKATRAVPLKPSIVME